jgi:class 3 adenylate cyclase/CHASE2 domain-containing sensor protein
VKLNLFQRAPVLIAVGVTGLACLVQGLHNDFVERIERMTYDWRVREAVKFPNPVATNLAYVDISDNSIELVKKGLLGRPYGLYWPRHIYGRMVNELAAQGVKAIGFDILFAELRRDHDPLTVNGQPVESDDFFANEMKRAGNVVLASQQGVLPAPLFRTNALAIGDIDADKDSDGILRRAKAFRIYRKWNRAFQQLEDDPEYGVDLSRAQVEPRRIILPRSEGDPITIPLNQDGDFDLADFVGPKIPAGMARYSKPFIAERMWHMGIVLAAQTLKLDLAHPRIDLAGGKIILTGPGGIQRVIPVDSDGYFYVDWCLTPNDPRLLQEPIEAFLSEYQVRADGATNSSVVGLASYWRGKTVNWRDKLVVVGSSATGNDLSDRGATPLVKATVLMSEHWNVANSILTGKFIHRSSLFMDFVIIICMGALSAFLTWNCRSYIASLWIMVALFIYTGITVFAYVKFRYWMPLMLPLTGGLLTTHFSLLAYVVIFEQAERRRVRSVFTKVVSPDVVTELLKTEKLSLTGARRKVTVFFSDIRGFTEMTDVNRDKAADYIKENNLTGEQATEIEDAQARETLATVNQYLRIIADVVLKHSGTVDKFIGDCVMAFWGAPVHDSHHALHCVRAAIDTQRAVYKLNLEREAENRQREAQNLMLVADGKPLLPMLAILVVGTGINTGDVTVGLMGSDERVNYTVFGREVNLASRLETVSGRGRIIISESTLAEIIQDDSTLALSCKTLPPEKVKGIREAVRIYEVPWREDGEPPAAENPSKTDSTRIYSTGYFTAADRT